MAQADVIIVGAGVSGLATAYFLSRRGIRAILIEKSDRVGGLIKTDLVDGCQLEAGPDSYISTKPAVTQLTRQIPSLSECEISSNDAQRRIFVVRGGKLVAMPQGMSMMVPGQWKPMLTSALFGAGAKLSFLAETLSRPRQRNEDFSIGEFVQDHFNREVLDYVTDPLLTGVYGGDAESLSARSVLPRFVEFERTHGSLIRGLRSEQKSAAPKGSLFRSLKAGMQSLTDALADSVRGFAEIVHTEATELRRANDGWCVRVTNLGQYQAPEVVLACPAYSCASLLSASAPNLAAELTAIPYSSSIVATLVYETSSFTRSLDGFGFLVPRAEQRTVAAATWINTKFPSRIRDGLVALRTFIVGKTAEQLLDAPDGELLKLVRNDIQMLMGISAEPRFSNVYRWPKSMPQYIVGHGERCARIAAIAGELPGLHLVGNSYDGVGIPDCVRLAEQAAKLIINTLHAVIV